MWKAITAYPCCRTRSVRVTRRGHFTIKPIADMNMARQIHMFYRLEFRGAELLGDVQKLYYEVMSE